MPISVEIVQDKFMVDTISEHKTISYDEAEDIVEELKSLITKEEKLPIY
ncbi:hypothetical protein BHOIPH791_07680 [Bartonella henselae]|nr:hypothetical protein [Bartonella henselae]MDM9984320.1 hypothetical protein [Bartonella henselae]MDM9994860.1 hypothetical protein [Bartonella henselae]UJM38263.1 hypothetical protein KAE72_04805 [Bartonella henselae]UJM39735.1 hypothetical protein KAE74_04785 [Bartonella henselae]GFF02241.1 hypothetical protein BH623125_06750 [Bartonella henselae]